MRSLQDVPRILPADGDYPNGRIGNSEPAQGGNPAIVGTAIVEELQGDLIQLIQKLIIDAGVVPNGLPDNVSNGYQLLEAFNAKILQTALASSLISRTAFDNVFTKLNTGSIDSILFDNNPSDIIRIGDAQTAIFDLDNVSLVINGIMRDGSIDVPVGTRIAVTFKNVAAGTSLRIAASGLSGFVFNFDGLTGSLPLVAGVDNTFIFKFLGVDPDQSSKKVILVESAPGYVLSQLNAKANESDVIIKGGGDAYAPAADTDPVNKGYVDNPPAPAILAISFNPTNTSSSFGRVAHNSSVVNITGEFEETGAFDIGDPAFTLQASVPAPLHDVYIPCSNHTGGSGLTLRILAGTRIALLLRDGDGTPLVSFNASYLY